MRIGIICEGGPVSKQRNSTTDNPDARVIESFINLLSPGHEFVFNPLGNKPNLKAQCGRVTQALLEIEECDIVFVFWDLYPAWSELKKTRPCQREDREAILHSLAEAGLGENQNIFPVCVKAELESILLHDERALSAVLSSTTRPVTLTRSSVSTTDTNPKKTLAQLFSNYRKSYNPAVDNPKIARAIENDARVRRHAAFARLGEKLLIAEQIRTGNRN